MNSYLRPFASSLRKMFTNGFEWKNQTLDRVTNSKVIAPIACLDAPAKGSVDNLMLYNGENSCANCEAKGESSATGAGSNWVFPIVAELPPLRSAERMEIQTSIVEKFENLKHFKGVKGASAVTDIPHFDRSKGFVPDYMHAVLLGVMLMFLTLWTNSKNHLEPFYLSKDTRSQIDKILETITPPDDVTRTPRKLSQLNDWKASELRAFLIYYGPIVLKNRLNDLYFQHFLILVKAIHLLNQEEISPNDIDFAETLLNIFVIDVERLYGKSKCSYNIHQLLHLPFNVKMWGPLWAWSAFSSEDQNGELVKMTHGSNKIDVELANTVKIIQAHRSIKYLMQTERILNEHQCSTFGPITRHDITDSEFRAICYATHLNKEQLLNLKIKIFSRCKINNDIFTSKLYTRQKKRSNFYVKCKMNESIFFGAVKYYRKVQEISYAVIDKLVVTLDKSNEIKHRETGFNLNANIKHIRESYNIQIVPLINILSKCLRVEDYICIFINNMERK